VTNDLVKTAYVGKAWDGDQLVLFPHLDKVAVAMITADATLIIGRVKSLQLNPQRGQYKPLRY
jgi:hypothetical protein